MSHRQPTLAELREVVQKARHREIGNWLARRVARPTAVYGTWVAVRLGLSANQVTLASLLTSLAGAAAIGGGSRSGFVLGTILLHLGFWLDHVDGQVARWRRTASLNGVYLDYLMHHVVNLSLGFGLGCGLAMRSGNLLWSVAGFALAVGWGLLALHNDCRYKAFFQRLKSISGSYRVDGGSGGRPAPPASWPRRGLGLLSWPAYKLCEPHVVLICLTGPAAVAMFFPGLWIGSWKLGVAGMALLAPSLAAARIGRSVGRGTVEAEFVRWFQPVGPSGSLQQADLLSSPHLPLDRLATAVLSEGDRLSTAS
jgi:CDP-alcohol phosphatidyltransferase